MKKIPAPLSLALMAALLFIPFLGGVHLFDWDEINFAECSREMLLTNDFLRVHIDFQPFWEKPPLFFWIQALSMKVFGINEFAARLPNAICGILNLALVFKIGEKVFDRSFGWLWALVYLGTLLPNLYSHSGIIDPWFNLFIFSSLYFFILFHWKKNEYTLDLSRPKISYLFLSGILLGLAMLTKGQAALIIMVLCFFVYWIYQKFRMYIGVLEFLAFTFFALLLPLAWYGLETWKNGPWFVQEFLKYQYRLFSTPDAGHGGFPGFHLVVLLLGCFPASIFAIRAFFKMPKHDLLHQRDFSLWMKILFWVVLILFSIVQSKIVHYSSLCYFPLTFLASLILYKIWKNELHFASWMKWGTFIIASLFTIAFIALPFLSKNIESLLPLIKDPFARANLNASTNWTGWDVVPGIFLAILSILSLWYLEKRKGIILLFLGTAIFVNLALYFSIGKIEMISQNAAIEFFKEKANEDCYVLPVGYKTYAHLFYGQRPKDLPSESRQLNWLLNKEVDKPVYLITKIHKTKRLEKFKNLKEIGRKNGFVFYKKRE